MQKHRLSRNETQEELAEKAGISRSTLIRFERGESVQLVAFLAILRQMNMLHNLEALIPAHEGASPMQQLAKTPLRKRARGKK